MCVSTNELIKLLECIFGEEARAVQFVCAYLEWRSILCVHVEHYGIYSACHIIVPILRQPGRLASLANKHMYSMEIVSTGRCVWYMPLLPGVAQEYSSWNCDWPGETTSAEVDCPPVTDTATPAPRPHPQLPWRPSGHVTWGRRGR